MGDASGGDVLSVPDPAHREVAIRENIPDTLAESRSGHGGGDGGGVGGGRRPRTASSGNREGLVRLPGGMDRRLGLGRGGFRDGDGHEEGDADMDGGGEDGFGAEDGDARGAGVTSETSPTTTRSGSNRATAPGSATRSQTRRRSGTLDDAQRDSVKRAMLQAAEDEELDFPDEVETPLHLPARERFARVPRAQVLPQLALGCQGTAPARLRARVRVRKLSTRRATRPPRTRRTRRFLGVR